MDEQQVRLCINLFLEPGQITELRVPNVGGRTFTKYFLREEVDDLVQEAKALNGKAAGIYFVPNPVKQKQLGATGDGDIIKRRWFLLDFDPVRPPNVSSTEEEKEAARQVCLACDQSLRSEGWVDPIFSDSGNGYHLCYPCDMPNTEPVRQTTSLTLRRLSRQFTTKAVKIDTSVFNASRIWKLYGTMAGKGENTPERPHRHAKIIGVLQ